MVSSVRKLIEGDSNSIIIDSKFLFKSFPEKQNMQSSLLLTFIENLKQNQTTPSISSYFPLLSLSVFQPPVGQELTPLLF